MSGVSPYELLTFASSSVAAALGALLLGLRIPGGQALGTLRTARGYLALGCGRFRRHVPASGRRG